MSDQFSSDKVGLNSPGMCSYTFTTSDSADLSPLPRQVRFDTAGTVSFFLVGDDITGTARSITVSAGETLSWRFRRLMAATTATGTCIY